eukprot:TRINITY_DN30669_c0_g1_i1.p1 TRINITY_DN30669_c0_g1~~TRINITY_DN30669_c0_g1_i1.p1  ORF type:complete len:407 (+),score=46.50 TRINITY_DN30669_c0_g1_i1:66-1286(+)
MGSVKLPLLTYLSALIQPIFAWDNGMARLPPLAWSSWYALSTGTSCTSPKNQLSEEAVLKSADGLLNHGLHDLGFRTMIIDDCWQNSSRDEEGYLHADPKVFPRGMGFVSTWLKRRGLNLGIYTTPGHLSCMKRPASEGFEKEDAELWLGEWDVRWLKYCVCNTTHARREVAYAQMQEIIAAGGWNVTYEIDPAMEYPMTKMDQIGNVVGAHDDVADNYTAWVAAINDLVSWDVYTGTHTRPGHWPLIDIVQIGKGGQSFDEYRSQVSMYAMLCSPLVLGIDFRNSSWVKQALPHLRNEEVLAIHQDPLGQPAHRRLQQGGGEIWIRPLHDKSYVVALWNKGSRPSTLSFDIAAFLGSQDNMWQVRDVWARKTLGETSSDWTVRGIPAHGISLLRVSLKNNFAIQI